MPEPGSEPSPVVVQVRISAAHHGDNTFYDLGPVEHEVTAEQLWRRLVNDPSTECCRVVESSHTVCWLADQIVLTSTDPGPALGDSRELPEHLASLLLGADVREALETRRDEGWPGRQAV